MNKNLITLRAEKNGKDIHHLLYMPDGTLIPGLINSIVDQDIDYAMGKKEGNAKVTAVFYCNIAESKEDAIK